MILDFFRRLLEEARVVAATANDPVPADRGVVRVTAGELDVTDIRAIANPWRVDGKGRRWSAKGARRPWTKVTGVCLHQTACVLGERPERWATVGAHYGVMRSGRVVGIYDDDLWIAHGNGWNAGTVGIEIDGLLAGVDGDLATVWDDPSTPKRELPTTLTDEQVRSTCELIRRIHGRVTANGGTLRALVAHRQASSSRRNDPGSAVWKRIAMPMSLELSLSDGGRGFTLGDGFPIPEVWDLDKKGIPY